MTRFDFRWEMCVTGGKKIFYISGAKYNIVFISIFAKFREALVFICVEYNLEAFLTFFPCEKHCSSYTSYNYCQSVILFVSFVHCIQSHHNNK